MLILSLIKAAVGSLNIHNAKPFAPLSAALDHSAKPLPPNDAPNMHTHFAVLEAEHQGCQPLTSKNNTSKSKLWCDIGYWSAKTLKLI